MDLAISMVALGANAKISGSGIVKAWTKRWPAGPLPTKAEKKDATLSFSVAEGTVIYGLMPAPIPWSDLEGPCAAGIFWNDATAQMKQHKRHVIVTVFGESDPVRGMTLLTQATVALVEGCEGVIGIYWCNSSLVFPPERFSEIACTFVPRAPALPIWINFGFVKNPDGTTSGFTRGLESLGQMEFETQNSPEPPAELRNRFVGLAGYVLENPSAIKDGDTIGESATEKIKINFAESSFGSRGQVMRLNYPGKGSGAGSRMTMYGRIHLIATLLTTIIFGWLLYALIPILQGSFLRHVVFIPATLFFGLIFLLVSDRILQKMFGFEAFAES